MLHLLLNIPVLMVPLPSYTRKNLRPKTLTGRPKSKTLNHYPHTWEKSGRPRVFEVQLTGVGGIKGSPLNQKYETRVVDGENWRS